jgi:glucosyl-dolichyl phosphate glucuronosyltransferase
VSAPAVSVVVCTYTEERWDDLVAAVASAAAQTVPGGPVEVVVVADHAPALEDRVRREIAGVHVVANPGARGLSPARNAGVAAARGAIVAFLDDDCVAAPGWLARLAGHLAAPDVAAAGGAVVPRWDAGRPAWFPPEFDWVVGCSHRGLPTATADVRNLIGANMAFRRAVLATAGGFRDGLGRIGRVPLGCEETELCLRIAAALPGARIVYDPAAVVVHRVPAARAGPRYFAARCWGEGVSKAAVARLAGSRRGLAAERRHAFRTLPAGTVRALGDGAPLRAGAIGAGLAITTLGYVRGRAAPGAPPASAPPRDVEPPEPPLLGARPRSARAASRRARSAAPARSGRRRPS